ncbi:hypothetical protein V6N13_123143 [Hibiscus sabdariffa]|uniref:Uncharacterized protein n=1 Tax=Hibiscus sabdariffa TaxID=183260 RepID=A0ABR2NV03_9ROSI
MDGRKSLEGWKIRLSLWSEHLGLCQGEINKIIDRITDSSYKDLWVGTAKACILERKTRSHHNRLESESYHNGEIKRVDAMDRLKSRVTIIRLIPWSLNPISPLQTGFAEP